jgi:hypothetical protein
VKIPTYTYFGGKHAETASLTNVLRAQGVRAPHNGEPFSEAMILGIGGGLGAGYILWEFKEHNSRTAVFGWRNRWQYSVRFYEILCQRLNVGATFRETSSPKAAAQHLDAALDEGHPVVAWVESGEMPDGHYGHQIAIYGIEDDNVLVDNLAAKPYRVPVETMATARNRVVSYKNRLLLTTPNGEVDLPSAIAAGIQDELDHLSQDSDSFSLPTFQKWGKMMTNRKNPKGWHVVFADRRSLYDALKSVYEGVELISTGGGGMRGLYADFLDEAAGIVNDGLRDVAKVYRSLAAQWSAFADAALPDNIDPMRETKDLLRQRYEILMTHGGEAADKIRPLSDRLHALQTQFHDNVPMSDAEIDAHFVMLGEQLLTLYQAELDALAVLKEAAR